MLSLTTYIKFIAGTLFAVQLLHVQAQHGHGGGQGGGGGGGGQGQMSSPYAPVFVECPKDLAVRNASEVVLATQIHIHTGVMTDSSAGPFQSRGGLAAYALAACHPSSALIPRARQHH